MGASLPVRLHLEAPKRRDASGGAGSGYRDAYQERARSGARGLAHEMIILLRFVKGLNVIFWPHFGLWEECFEPVAGLRTRQGGAARMRGQALIRSRPASQDGARGRPANR